MSTDTCVCVLNAILRESLVGFLRSARGLLPIIFDFTCVAALLYATFADRPASPNQTRCNLLSQDISSFKRPDSNQVSVIVDAAELCFSRMGYAGASMREIAEKAGVSKSLLHYHFDSKEHLFVEVQIRFYERLGARIAEAVAPLKHGQERGLLAFDALFDVLRANQALATLAELWASALANEKLRTHVIRLREFFRRMLAERIREILGEEADSLPLTSEAAADFLWATLNGIGITAAFGEPKERIDRAIASLRTLVAMALNAKAQQGLLSQPNPTIHPTNVS